MKIQKIYIIILLFILLAGMAKGVSDTLQFHYSKSVFQEFKNEEWFNPAISWKNKYRDYDNGDLREAYLGSRSLFVWHTDAWHLAQTIETLAWVLALLATVKLGCLRARLPVSQDAKSNCIMFATFFVLSLFVFYSGFLLLYGWLLMG